MGNTQSDALNKLLLDIKHVNELLNMANLYGVGNTTTAGQTIKLNGWVPTSTPKPVNKKLTKAESDKRLALIAVRKEATDKRRALHAFYMQELKNIREEERVNKLKITRGS